MSAARRYSTSTGSVASAGTSPASTAIGRSRTDAQNVRTASRAHRVTLDTSSGQNVALTASRMNPKR